MVGINSSIAPERSCSSRTIAQILLSTRNPSGKKAYMPAASCRIMPARNISRWDTSSASLGVSRRMGKKYRDSRIGSALDLLMGHAPHRNRITAKTQEHQRVQGPLTLSRAPSEARRRNSDHGAVHDKPDDKLKLIKYQLSTRNQGGQQRDINVILASAGAGVVQV